MNKPDETLNLVHDGQAARLIRGQTEEWLINREEDIIQVLVNDYNAGTLTDEKMRGSIGEIAGHRKFRTELEARIRRGVVAAEKELGQGDGEEKNPDDY